MELNSYETTVRDWIESRLPADIMALDERYAPLQTQLTAGLLQEGMLQSSEQFGKEGYVSGIKLTRPAGSTEMLIVQAGVWVPCGSDVTLYVYRFTGTARIRLVEVNGESSWGSRLLDAQLSAPDETGNRILFAAWDSVQCGSSWNTLDYRLYRVAPDAERAVNVFSDTQWYNTEDGVNVKLSAGELLLEFTSDALEGGYRRTHVMHYQISAEGAQRIDPVALQPEDFVHEWLERPSSEMASRSSESAMKLHKFLRAADIRAEYFFVQPCQKHPGLTQAAIAIDSMSDHELPEPLKVYFLIEDKGEYRFNMSDVSFDRQPGCPGELTAGYDKRLSLFKK